MNLLSQNSKLKKSKDKRSFNFGIPAYRAADGFKTCPNAAACAAGCYARSGAYIFSNVARVFEQRLTATRSPLFEQLILQELRDKRVERLRVHDSGDFYSETYLRRWLAIAVSAPDVEFYAYTKMISMVRRVMADGWPSNFTIIFSYGGTEDKLIDPEVDRHSAVFQSHHARRRAGYADVTVDDSRALGKNPKVGLVYHGTKNFENTNWGKVKKVG